MKSILLVITILSIAQFSNSAPADEAAKTVACSKYPAINITVNQLAGEWYVQGYGFNGKNEHPTLKCQKRKFIINADGLTGSLETSNADPATGKPRTFTSPFFVARPGVLILGQEPESPTTRSLTVLYLDNNYLAYHLMTSGCGTGEQINEPRLASRALATTKTPELLAIMKGLSTAGDYKEYREIPHDCPK